ncbi:hypothetical protein DPPLL_22460 [Desulfofustis limnaeus]|uniref:Lipoprotein n=2 Tax=Desulfofustis limnaeus TaxID=2740163 RepID=A0ABN6M4S2_9BACT|nr:hypothetical protein DPPLL_22460 [Desulfofustis limnaeus]
MKTHNTLLLLLLTMALISSCASMHTWPDDERNAESKMVTIEQRLGDGLQTGRLTPDQTQMFLTSLKGIRTDYSELRNKPVYQEEWSNLQRRLDLLDDEINRALMRGNGDWALVYQDQVVSLQRDLDAARIGNRLSSNEERDFQARLDSIRRDAVRLSERGNSTRFQERADLSRRLDALARDLARFR